MAAAWFSSTSRQWPLIVALAAVVMVWGIEPGVTKADGHITFSPTHLDFGEVIIGASSAPQAITVTNIGPTPVVVDIAGGGAGVFGGQQNCQGNTLVSGGSCQFVYMFTPTTAGLINESTNGTVNGVPFAFTFSGIALQPITFSPTHLDFGDVAIGVTSPPQAITVTNIGPITIVVDIAGGGAGVFGGQQNCQGNTLVTGASCQFFYAFSPVVPGIINESTSGIMNGVPFAFTFVGNAVIDTEPPTITVANITVGTDPDQAGAIVLFSPIASDNAAGVTVVCIPPSGSFFVLGETTVTCTATDGVGNFATASFTVTVVDQQPPNIVVPASIIAPNDPGAAGRVVSGNIVTATDNVAVLQIECDPPLNGFFPLGQTDITCTATDAAGNEATATFFVLINDEEDPVLSLPASFALSPNVLGATLVYPPPTATDNAPGVSASCDFASGRHLAPGLHTVTCTATDSSGNTDVESFTVRVLEVPVFLNPLPAATTAPTVVPTSAPTSTPAAPSATPTPIPTAPLSTTSPSTPAASPPPSGTLAPAGPGSAPTPLPPRTGTGPVEDEPLQEWLLAAGVLLSALGLAIVRRRQ